MDKVIGVERSKITKRWVQSTGSCGLCFTISYDRFEEILKSGKLPDHWKLKKDEFVERFKTDMNGVTVYIGKKD